MNEQQKKRIGKFISLILRHEPEKIGLTLDDTGWAEVDALLAGMERAGRGISFTQLQDIVATNDKQRYRFNDDQTRIRASQGHSLKLNLQLQAQSPPTVLYHGTASRFMASIMRQGLLRGNRHHVHLSTDTDTARKVGSRHGKVVILQINATAMQQDGYEFYCSDNGVWLTTHVPANYLQQL